MKKIICVLLIAITILSLSSCMGLESKKTDITILTYNIPINDGGIGSKYLDGLKMIGNQAALSYFENLVSNEFEANLNKISSENHDYVFLIQPYGYDNLLKTAKEHPEIGFGISDVDEASIPDNITTITYRYYEGTYIAGFVAAKSLKSSKKIGILTETDKSYVKKYVNAFKGGALNVDRSIEFEEKILGIDYTQEEALAAASELYDNGCEIVFQDLFRPDGAIEAAEKNGKYTIGIGVDQSIKSSSAVLTTVTANYDIVLSEVLGKFIANNDIGGKNFDFGISDFAISLSKTTKNIDKDVVSEASKISDSIFNGELGIPVSDAEIDALKNTPAEETAEPAETESSN